ncbi:hypothetical protein PV08_08636 [Exophiala spinifera]|uniref:Uncharacterized protein n=1 Tax=Exophiala spinifera TaxID=91928 RepID=A0A0D2B3I4_9EURO|nr:uncharacterized protein PV08_08636 [Exophiala spinifera]KIW13448.1 hypothetical protein PV08_08636 [Exophiala spinifera]
MPTPGFILESSDLRIVTTRFPRGPMEGRYVTGLQGRCARQFHLVINAQQGTSRTIEAGEHWMIRWDYDPEKGPHVNASFGTSNATKFAFKPVPRHAGQRDDDPYWEAILDQSRSIAFDKHRTDSYPIDAKHLAERWIHRYWGPAPNWTAQIHR